jgi:GT2 family glycosyltransferase
MTPSSAEPPIDVSVIVIGVDVRDEILPCLESVHRHAGRQRVETIYVDNGSTDGSADLVAQQGLAARVVRLGHNQGGSARNHGMDVARGRLRMFLDSDARLTEGALDELVDFLDTHPQVGLVGPRLVYPDGGPQPSARRVPGPYLPFLRRPPLARFTDNGRIVRHHLMEREMREAPDRVREVEYVIGACQLFTEAAERMAGRLDTRIPFAPEDIDWCLHIRRGGYRIAYDPAATVIHGYRRTSAQQPFSRKSAEHFYGFVIFLLKWRRSWRALRADGRRIDRADGRLPVAPDARRPTAR